MAEMSKTYTVKNTANGPRGFYDASGALVMLEPGEKATDVEVTAIEAKSASVLGLRFGEGGDDDEQDAGPAISEMTVDQVLEQAEQAIRAARDEAQAANDRANAAEVENEQLRADLEHANAKLAAFDRDGDGQPGGGAPLEPPALSGKTKAELLEIAAAEGVDVPDGATNAQITDAIEAKRSQ